MDYKLRLSQWLYYTLKKKAQYVDFCFGNSGGGTQLKSQQFRNFFDSFLQLDGTAVHVTCFFLSDLLEK